MSLQEIKKAERRLYLRYAAFLLIGIVMMAIGWRMHAVWADVLVIGGIIVGLVALVLFSSSVNTFYRVKGKIREEETGEEFKETYVEWPEWTKKYGWIPANIFIFLFILVFARKHENNFGGNSFVWHSVLFGALAGFVIYQLLKLKFTSWTSGRNKAIEIAFWITIASIIFFVGLAPVINQGFASSPVNCREYRLADRITNVTSRTKYIKVFVNNRPERFKPPGYFMRSISEKDSVIILCVQKGYLGYDFVKEYKLKE